MFVPGTLTLVTRAAGRRDATTATPTGGSKGTGLLDVRNLTLGRCGIAERHRDDRVHGAAGAGHRERHDRPEPGASCSIAGAEATQSSDDPACRRHAGSDRGSRFESAPVFRVQKTSQDVTGDPNVLLAGETLRYTITVKNIGNANATDAVLRDQIPVNTTYVAGSTTLNGARSPIAAALSPLVNGMPINAPEDPTPGSMRADASATPSNVATITFDVVVNADVIDGTVISNQGFVSASADGIVDYPSDDPATPIAERSDARHRRQPAAALLPRSAPRCRSTTARRASSIRATCCATRSRCTTTASVPRPASCCATRCRRTRPTSRTRTLLNGTARRPAGWRRLAAHRGIDISSSI